MNRDELAAAVMAQPFDTDVQVNLGGFLIDITHVGFDLRRHAIVLELLSEDVEQTMRRLSRSGP